MNLSPPSAAVERPVGDRAVLEALLAWRAAGSAVALLTVAAARRGAHCVPGALLAVRDDGATFGAVPRIGIDDLLHARLRSGRLPAGRPERLAGGALEFVFERLPDDDALPRLHAAIARRAPRVRRLHLPDGRVEIADQGRDFHCDARVLERRFEPDWRLLLTGATTLAAHLVHGAAHLGYEITLCEPRAAQRAAWNLGDAAHGLMIDPRPPAELAALMADDERTAIIGVSGDPSIDGPALTRALAGRAFYVAAVGAAAGARPEFHGLCRSPAETAVTLLAELTAARHHARNALRAEATSP